MDFKDSDQNAESVSSNSSSADKWLSPQKLIDSNTLAIHSTPMPSSDKDVEDLNMSVPGASPILGRTSGRARKKTEKGAAFHESVKKKVCHEHSGVDVGNVADSSDQASAESIEVVSGNVSCSSHKRGRPRKSETVMGDTATVESVELNVDTDVSDKVSNKCKSSSPQKSETVSHDSEAKGTAEKNSNTRSTVDVKSVCDPSKKASGSTEQSADVLLNVSHTSRKRGRPRKSDKANHESRESAKNSSNVWSAEHVTSAADPDKHFTNQSEELSTNVQCRRGQPGKSETSSCNREGEENADKSGDTSSTVHMKSRTDPSKQVSSNMPNPPRKRGRPRKSETVRCTLDAAETSGNVDVSLNVSSSLCKRVYLQKGGSVSNDVTGEEITEGNVLAQSSADIQLTMESRAEQESQTVVKRKRGRPKKQKPLVAETCPKSQGPSEEKEEEFKGRRSSRKRQRPAWSYKEEDEESAEARRQSRNTTHQQEEDEGKAEEAEEEEKMVVRKKPGRKPKAKKMEEDESTHSEKVARKEEDQEIKSLRKRRRPVWSHEEEKEEDSAEEGAKRRRQSGKTVSPQGAEEEGKEDRKKEKVVKKRGQKPKAKQPEDDESAHIEACLRCGEKMEDLSKYKYHLVSRHAALYSKECPEGEQTHAAIRKILQKFKYINCPDCRKAFRFPQYFQHHLKWCGREKEKVICSLCGHKVMAMWMEQHDRDHRKKEAQKEAQKEAEFKVEEESTNGSSKRKAAAASLLKMKAIAKENQDSAEGGPKKRRNKAKHDDDWDGEDHSEDEGDEDVEEESGLDVEKQPFGSGGCPVDEQNEDYGPGVTIRADGRKIFFRVPDSFEQHCDFLERLPKGKLFTSLLPRRAEWIPLPESDVDVFLSYDIPSPRFISDVAVCSESITYLPMTRESVPVSIRREKDQHTDPAILRWGESICDNKQGTAFVGGSVWSMEWCPLDEEVGQREQVLAVSASREVWSDWFLFKRGEGPGLIQFWTTGSLDKWGPDSCLSLKLAFSLAHESLHVLSMAWCPRGAYHHSSSESKDALPRLGLLAVAGYNSNVTVYSLQKSYPSFLQPRKLGSTKSLLSFLQPGKSVLTWGASPSEACLSEIIPTPEAVESCESDAGGEKSTPPTFKPAPTLTLLCSAPEVTGACLSVAWQKGGDCDFIAGGYAKGYVHLWHISTTSSLVRCSPEALGAVRVFYAHYGVMSVDWSWLTPTQFVTGSLENQIRLWDLKDTRTPLVDFPDNMIWEKGPTRVVTFGSSAHDSVLFADDQRDGTSGGVYALDLSLGLPRGADAKKANRSLSRHAAAVWDIGYSPWFNMVGSGDSTGLLYLSSCVHVPLIYIRGYTRARQGVTVFSTTCTQSPDAQRMEKSKEKDLTSDNKVTSAEGLQITFNDTNMEEDKDFMKTGKEVSATRQVVGSFRAADIYSVCFNPNKMSSAWMACGTRAGFVRLLHVPCLALQSRTAKDLFKLKTHKAECKAMR